MDIFLRAADMSEQELLDMIGPPRDPAIWEKGADGTWRAKDSVANHVNDPGVEEARMPLVENTRPFIVTPERDDPHAQKGGEQTE